ncbi:hypothetical protein BIW11_09942 [Tropilaelaps mercedesae]|uniref:Secreted protein n=1 Tax=Tropilaelaps mercedesae TaxID=418985 RepID=A0A1V9XIC5_9ACAR|nr:hypothetical protein BIW11_09942 [Tropilaelaps mercedesae]
MTVFSVRITLTLCLVSSISELANGQTSPSVIAEPTQALFTGIPIPGLPVAGRQQQPPAPQSQHVIPPNQPGANAGTTFGGYSAEVLCAQGPGLMQGYPAYQHSVGLFAFGLSGASSNPCIVTCQNQQAAWMVAKPHGAPCRHPNDPQGERYCLNQVCVPYNASLNEYCRNALSLPVNSPDYMALMPYGCTVTCLDKSTPSLVQVQFNNGMSCHVNTPGGRQMAGYCMNGACSTLSYRGGPGGGGFFETFLDSRKGALLGAGGPPGQGYPYLPSQTAPYNGYGVGGPFGVLSNFLGRRRK